MGRTYRNLDKNKKKAIREGRNKRKKRIINDDQRQERRGGQDRGNNRYESN